MGDLDPTINGTLASSQKEKLDKMKRWVSNPFKAYECKKKKNKNYYYLELEAKDNKRVCADCRSCRKKEMQMQGSPKGHEGEERESIGGVSRGAGILDEVDMVNYKL
eukprot:scaffold30203_cov61-Cyclotella_meneghiniana.AAC.1